VVLAIGGAFRFGMFMLIFCAFEHKFMRLAISASRIFL